MGKSENSRLPKSHRKPQPYPVEHTVSPFMQNSAFRALNLDYVYVPFSIPPENLLQALKAMKVLNFVGFNVTIPHKRAITKYLDKVEGFARKIGCVNTVVNREGEFLGFNTDGEGFLMSLKEEKVEIEGKDILLIGAGGSAWAIAFSIMKKNPKRLFILNRNMDNAEMLRLRLSMAFRKATILTLPHQKEPLKFTLQVTDLLINATPVGMDGKSMPEFIDPKHLSEGAVVYDLIYSPPLTPLLKKAKRRKLKVINGEKMLLHQGALAFKLWTGKEPPVEVMREALKKVLSTKRRKNR